MSKLAGAVGVACALMSVLLTGCASIVKGKSQEIEINSLPQQARYQIHDNKGQTSPIEGTTPGKVTLKRGAGYFRGGDYTVTLIKPGYEPTSVNLKSGVNGWYVGGNLLLGGLIGYLAVDPATGAMWNLKPENLQVALTPVAASAPPAPLAQPPLAAAVSTATPAATPVVAAGAPSAFVVSTAVPGPASLKVSTGVLAQPKLQGQVQSVLPAGAELQARNRLINAEGAWWFVQHENIRGWVPESAFDPTTLSR